VPLRSWPALPIEDLIVIGLVYDSTEIGTDSPSSPPTIVVSVDGTFSGGFVWSNGVPGPEFRGRAAGPHADCP
jgi:hypothetical protein